MRLPATLQAWKSAQFEAVCKNELRALGAAVLPLQQCVSTTSVALDEGFEPVVLGADEDAQYLRIRLGVFFSGLAAGCSCAGDPTPVEPQSEYCELLLSVDKTTAEAVAAPLSP